MTKKLLFYFLIYIKYYLKLFLFLKMGSECSADERETKYMSFHQAIYAIENDIKKEIDNSDLTNKKYMPFGLVNQGLCKKYKFLLNPNFDKDEARNTQFNYKYLIKKNEDRNFRYINKNFNFNFPSQFMFINKDFMDVILDYVGENYKSILKTNFDTIIGGGCLIMKNPSDPKDEKPYRYIILYSELKENKGNEIDFFLSIKVKKERKKADDYILKNNLLNYFKKIDYNFKEEYKKVSDNYYIVRCCEVSKIENYISEMEKKKKNEKNTSRYKRSMSLNQKKNAFPQNNFRNHESNMRNIFNNIFEQNQRPNNIQSIKMSFNPNQKYC